MHYWPQKAIIRKALTGYDVILTVKGYHSQNMGTDSVFHFTVTPQER